MSSDFYVWSLLNEGDWACAHADGEALAGVCERICACVGGDVAVRAHRIAAIAGHDLDAGSALWGDLAGDLRAQLAVVQE